MHNKEQTIAERINGFECSIEVDDIDVIIQAVKENGGRIVTPKTEIPHVGWFVKFLDNEKNIVCAIQYHQL